MNVDMKNIAQINEGYELMQIIMDFDNPLQIFREGFQNSIDEDSTIIVCKVYKKTILGGTDLYIDIIDNGVGLQRENAGCFFGLAKTSKLNFDGSRKENKLGYKGHGAKIFFNAESVSIVSKLENDYWGATCLNPMQQLRNTSKMQYSDCVHPKQLDMEIPNDFKTGFFVRIKNPTCFNTQSTWYRLCHIYLRDYIKWFTVFGTIKTLFDNNLLEKRVKLYLNALDFSIFNNEYITFSNIDPIPVFEYKYGGMFEVIDLGHYFPKERYTEKDMKQYAASVGDNKLYVDYYSKQVEKCRVDCGSNIYFDFVLFTEGYETKRRYDILLSRRGKNINPEFTHNDVDRYGIWACKGGVPIERIDDWYIGGKGSYTYMHAFVDCDSFELSANRGSVKNTSIEILDLIKKKLNEKLNEKHVQDDFKNRLEIIEMESKLRTVDEDAKELSRRYIDSSKRKNIIFPDGFTVPEPTKLKSGYSESETLILLYSIMTKYPNLFTFRILDYNTVKGIDFVVEHQGNPKYIELKGTLQNKINHSFRNIYKFICYDLGVKEGDLISDVEDFETALKINKNDKFFSNDINYNGIQFASYKLEPYSSCISSMEVIVLKKILKDLLGVTIE